MLNVHASKIFLMTKMQRSNDINMMTAGTLVTSFGNVYAFPHFRNSSPCKTDTADRQTDGQDT